MKPQHTEESKLNSNLKPKTSDLAQVDFNKFTFWFTESASFRCNISQL